jgi:hypothetical protein
LYFSKRPNCASKTKLGTIFVLLSFAGLEPKETETPLFVPIFVLKYRIHSVMLALGFIGLGFAWGFAQPSLKQVEQYRMKFYFQDPYEQLEARQHTQVQRADTQRQKLEVVAGYPANYDTLMRMMSPSAEARRMGYRIQIYLGNRNEATTARFKFMDQWPDYQVYSIFESPYFKVRVGDFLSKPAAERFLETIRKDFPSAFIVPDEVNPTRGKP